MDFTATARISFAISDEQLDDHLGSGCGYWARNLERTQEENRWRVDVFDPDSGEEDGTYFFTSADAVEAFGRCVENKSNSGERLFNKYTHSLFIRAVGGLDSEGLIDAGWIDDEAGDAWLQVILFDSVQWG